MAKIAVSYTRFSTLEQKKGQSASRQKEAFEKWCKEHGYTPSQERFLDEGKSAFKGSNLAKATGQRAEGDLRRFLSLVEAGRIRPGTVLVCEEFSRLSRLPMSKAVGLFMGIINSGIGIVLP